MFAGSYQLIQKLGEGGMGVVYLAKHPTLGKRAAVKLLQADLNNKSDATERFFSEAQIVSQLGHENIVDVYDFGLLDGEFPFFVMEYLEGEPLSQMLSREQLIVPETALDLTIQLLDALSVAHAHGVVHRDLKPDNTFLLPRRGRYLVKLLDFGIAKLKDASTKKLTKTGILIGTPQYMSPEQVESELELDGRADLYSVGILLYEMLCGRTPFVGNSLGLVALAHTFESPPPPRSLRPELSPAIEVILLKSLEKNRNNRYQSAEEMIQALQSLQGQPLLVATDSIATPPNGSMIVSHSKASFTNEKTGARANPFEELRSSRLQVEPALATSVAMTAPREERNNTSAINSFYSNISRPTTAMPLTISTRQPSVRGVTSLSPEAALLPPTMMIPIVSFDREDMPTEMISEEPPTKMALLVRADSVEQEMPTMYIETVLPKPDTQTEAVTQEASETNPEHKHAAPHHRSGAQALVTPKTPSLDTAPEDIASDPAKGNQANTVAIVLLSVLAAILWALAFR
jgi:serine/threonine protein kinase